MMPEITITLPQDEWMRVLNMLADYPFKTVAPLISNIQQQMMPQMPQMPKDQRPNGEVRISSS